MPEFDFICILQYWEYYEQSLLQMEKTQKIKYFFSFMSEDLQYFTYNASDKALYALIRVFVKSPTETI